jgi:anthranilate/para-aminobenzoate synthase component II
MYEDEIDLIKKYSKPILRICIFFEVLCYAYGEEVEYLCLRELGALNIKIIQNGHLLYDLLGDFFAYGCHRWKVSKLFALTSLAESYEGIEIIKHSILPHYSVQFHPEVLLKGEKTHKILTNFLNIMKNSK